MEPFIWIFEMDNQHFARLDMLSEKAFHETITSDELKEYLLLLDEWNVIEVTDYLDQPSFND